MNPITRIFKGQDVLDSPKYILLIHANNALLTNTKSIFTNSYNLFSTLLTFYNHLLQ